MQASYSSTGMQACKIVGRIVERIVFLVQLWQVQFSVNSQKIVLATILSTILLQSGSFYNFRYNSQRGASK